MGDAINGATGDLIDWGRGFGQILRTFPLTARGWAGGTWGPRSRRQQTVRGVRRSHRGGSRRADRSGAGGSGGDPKQHLIGQIDQSAKDAKTSVDIPRAPSTRCTGNNRAREQQRIELKRLRQEGPSKSGSRKVSDPKNPTTVLTSTASRMVAGQKETQFTTADDARLFAVQYAQKAGEYAQTFKSPARQGRCWRTRRRTSRAWCRCT